MYLESFLLINLYKKTCKFMKVSLVLLFACISQLLAIHVKGQNAVINLPSASLSVGQFLNEVEKQTNYLVIYSNREVDTQRNVDLEASSGTVAQYLDKAFAGTNVRHAFENDYIILTLSSALVERMKQGIPISGVVSDTEGNTLPGVNVVIKGTQQGTVTDLNGGYSLSVPNEDATLVFSFLGYASQEILVGNQRSINVTLSEGARELEEVVVVGYGTQKKVNLTGAVGIVSAEKLENRPITSTGVGLQGLIPNLNITMSNGDPTTGAAFNVRGFTSINGGNPLILVDGTPMDINRINPNDIASVVVLKDAAAAAIYGARGGFGVIMIETKQGAKGKAKVTLSTEQSLAKNILHYDPVTDPYVFKTWRNKANIRATGNPTYTPHSVEKSRIWSENPTHENAWEIIDGELNFYGNNDYINRLLSKFAPQQKYDMTISKATDDASFYVSLGYLNKDGYYKNKEWNDKYQRYNILMKADVKVKPWLQLDERILFNMENSDKPHSYGIDNSASIQSIVRVNPVSPLEFPDLPYYITQGDREKYEPYIGMAPGDTDTNSLLPYLKQGGRTKYSRGDLYLTQGVTLLPLKGLKIRGDYTYGDYKVKDHDSAPQVLIVNTNLKANDMLIVTTGSGNDAISDSYGHTRNHSLNVYAEYEMTQFAGHYLKAMAGFNQEWTLYETFNANAKTLLSPEIDNIGATTGAQST